MPMLRIVCMLVVVACASPSPPPHSPPSAPPRAAVQQPRHSEAARRSELAAAHRERLDEQATALAATCTTADAPPRCEPSCYTREPADPRAGKRMRGPVEIVHVVCMRGDTVVIVDELGGTLRPVRGRFPRVPKPSEVEAAVATALQPELRRGDVVRVHGAWRSRVHPQTHEELRCATASHYTRALAPLDACGARGNVACEAAGDHATYGINVVHYRLREARRLQRAGKEAECQQAALEAIAVARGLPRWRQYMSLNTAEWKPRARYRTRFDGVVDEDALFATAIAYGKDAEAVYAACGGAPNPKTTAAHEQSFHTCE